jgi:hypothetical protein
MSRSAITLLAVGAAVLFVLPAQALAQAPAPETLTLTNASPADGATVPLTPTGGIPWQIAFTGPPADAAVSVTVTSSPDTGPDGVSLLDANRVDFFFITTTDATPGVYAGKSDPGPDAWSEAAGGFYWQVRATWTDAAGMFHAAVSPIERIGVGTKAPPALTTPGSANAPGSPTAPGQSPSSTPRTTLAMASADATFYVRRVIRQRTKRQPRSLRVRCRRASSRSFRCRPTWRDSVNTYTATVTFTHSRSGQRILVRGTVRGRRASLRCTRTRSLRSCQRSFRWTVRTTARPVTTSRSRPTR